jgi:hypothetical protein
MPIAIRIERPLTAPRFLYGEGAVITFFEDRQGIIHKTASQIPLSYKQLFSVYDTIAGAFIDFFNKKSFPIQGIQTFSINDQQVTFFYISKEASALARSDNFFALPRSSSWHTLSYTIANLTAQIVVLPGQIITIGSNKQNDIVLPACVAELQIHKSHIEVRAQENSEKNIVELGESFLLNPPGIRLYLLPYSSSQNVGL